MSDQVTAVDCQIDAAVRALLPAVSEERLVAAVCAVLDRNGEGAGTVTLRLATDEEVRELNSSYRDSDSTTDVLSFPDGGDWPAIPGLPIHRGDIVIAVPTAVRQAQAGGHTLIAELELLAVHGALHLLGHDHEDEASQAAMWAAQQAILAELGAELKGPTEHHLGEHS